MTHLPTLGGQTAAMLHRCRARPDYRPEHEAPVVGGVGDRAELGFSVGMKITVFLSIFFRPRAAARRARRAEVCGSKSFLASSISQGVCPCNNCPSGQGGRLAVVGRDPRDQIAPVDHCSFDSRPYLAF